MLSSGVWRRSRPTGAFSPVFEILDLGLTMASPGLSPTTAHSEPNAKLKAAQELNNETLCYHLHAMNALDGRFLISMIR